MKNINKLNELNSINLYLISMIFIMVKYSDIQINSIYKFNSITGNNI